MLFTHETKLAHLKDNSTRLSGRVLHVNCFPLGSSTRNSVPGFFQFSALAGKFRSLFLFLVREPLKYVSGLTWSNKIIFTTSLPSFIFVSNERIVFGYNFFRMEC